MTDGVAIRRVTAADVPMVVPALCTLLMDCVDGGASVSFMHPMTHAKAERFWRRVAAGVADGTRALLVAEAPDGRVVGTVQLVLDVPENQPHRADVAKMLVHRGARRRGVAQRLMAAVEGAAREEGRSLLVLDTVTGSAAELLYHGAGWHRVGEIPRYALMPGGEPCSTTIFYKNV